MIENTVDKLEKWLDSRLDNVHTILPGKIVQYYGHSERKAKVKPLVKLRNTNNAIIEIQPIDNVPVIFSSTSKHAIMHPVKSDDKCLLLFSECSIGNFLDSAIEQDADDKTRFQLTDCIALLGMYSFRSVPILSDVGEDDFNLIFENARLQIKSLTNDVVLKSLLGKMTIQNTLGKVEINQAGFLNLLGATESFIKGDTICTALTTLCNSIVDASGNADAKISAIQQAFNIFKNQITNFKSIKIKGE